MKSFAQHKKFLLGRDDRNISKIQNNNGQENILNKNNSKIGHKVEPTASTLGLINWLGVGFVL